MKSIMPEKIATGNLVWYLITGLFGFILAGIRWYLCSLKEDVAGIKKDVKDMDKKFSREISGVHTRLDDHIDK